jgi:hypothetical protein
MGVCSRLLAAEKKEDGSGRRAKAEKKRWTHRRDAGQAEIGALRRCGARAGREFTGESREAGALASHGESLTTINSIDK